MRRAWSSVRHVERPVVSEAGVSLQLAYFSGSYFSPFVGVISRIPRLWSDSKALSFLVSQELQDPSRVLSWTAPWYFGDSEGCQFSASGQQLRVVDWRFQGLDLSFQEKNGKVGLFSGGCGKVQGTAVVKSSRGRSQFLIQKPRVCTLGHLPANLRVNI